MFFLLKTAFNDLKRSKVRTLLTSLGILVGVFSVIVLIAIGVGFQIFIEQQFDNLGTNLIIVFPGNVLSDDGGFQDNEGGFGSTVFDGKDVTAIKRLSKAEYVVPTFIKSTRVKAKQESKFTTLFASLPDIFVIRKLEVQEGVLFTNSDVRKKAKVAVLGPVIAEDLFGSSKAAMNQIIRIEGLRYVVKGVLKAKGGGGFGGPNFDTFVYLPLFSTFSLNPDGDILGIYVQPWSGDDVPILKEKIKEVMLRKYDEEEFSVIEQTQILGAVSSIFAMINSVLVAIGAISLLVGGIGIMNIMYASVTERTKEIGIRRALGATKKDILFHFFSESVVLSVLGGLMGLLLAVIGVFIVQRWFPAQINIVSVFVALGVSIAVGVFFGAFPAKRAANLSPIDAIRKR